jgi:tetratricopeptide (TPR) repeat protein
MEIDTGVGTVSPAGGRSTARADQVVGLLLLFLVAVVYSVTLAPSVSFWDSGEFIAASVILGVPHPPGTPLYVLLGRLFSLLPVATPAVRVNLLSATAGALAVFFLYRSLLLIGRRMLPSGATAEDRWTLRLGAAIGGLFAAFGTTCWINATEAEVYAPSLLVMTFCLWILLRWADRGEPDRDRASLLLIAYILSLSIGVHLGTYLALPAFLLFVLVVAPRVLLDPRFLAFALFLTLLGMTVHFYLPIRSALNPVIDEANPEKSGEFLDFLLRKQYKPNNPFVRQASWAFQFRMYWLAFQRQYGALLPLLGLAGVWIHYFRARRTFLLYAMLFLITSLFLIFYMNFTDHEVRERDYFFAPSFFFWGGWMGLGAFALVTRLKRGRSFAESGAFPAVAGVLLLLLPAALCARTFRERDRSADQIAHGYAWNILSFLEPDAILFTNGDNDTFPLWYLQEVEGVRKDVRVANLALLNTPWYIWQLKHLDAKVPFGFTDAEIEQLRPVRTRDGKIISVKERAVFDIIQASEWKRPVYFAVTVPDLMGLDKEKLVRLEGLVFRVVPMPVEDFVDLARCEENLWKNYDYKGVLGGDGFRDQAVARDSNEVKLVANYSAAFGRLAIRLRNEGRLDDAVRAMEVSGKISPRYRVYEGLMGALYAEAGRYEEAETLFVRQVDEYPDSLSPRLGLAFVREKQGRTAEADSLYRQGIRIAPDHEEAYLRLCRIRLQAGDLEGGREVMREWLAVRPDDSAARVQLEEIDRAIAARGANGGPS